MKLNKDFYRQIFKSNTMAEFLANQDIEPENIRRAVLLAPVSLRKKREILEGLSQIPEGVVFKNDIAPLNMAIDEMTLKGGEMLLLFQQFYGESAEFIAPFASWEELKERIKNNNELCEDLDDEEPLISYGAEKWISDGKNFKKTMEYIIAGGEVCGFRPAESGSRQKMLPIFGEYADLNLPMPFKPGDIVLIDCTPFAPPQRAVILESGDDPYENRSPIVLYYSFEKQMWKTGAIKRKRLLTDSSPAPLSPLYRIDYAPDPIFGENKLVSKRLKVVSEYIRGKEEGARKLFSFIFNFKCGENDSRKAGFTKEKLLDFLNEAC